MKYDLYNESCFDLFKRIDANSIDLILIDPPYEISIPTNFQSGKLKNDDTDRFRISMDFGNWDHDFNGLNIVISESYRILKNSGTIICFYDLWKIETLKNLYEQNNFNQIRFIEWIKSNPVPINSKINYLTNSREVAVCAVKGHKPTFNSEYDNGIYILPICHDKGRFHPTQKPIELIKQLIIKHSNFGDTVLDCFSGSGTTCAACIETGRNFIGCELNTDYYNKSMERLHKNNSGGIF